MKTMKRDYVAFMPKPDAATAARNLAIVFEHYNEKHPHSALKYRLSDTCHGDQLAADPVGYEQYD